MLRAAFPRRLFIAALALAAAALLFVGGTAPEAQAQSAPTANEDGTYTVIHNWPLIPSGLRTGDTFRLIFVSQETRWSTVSNIEHYDSWVQSRAAAGHSDIRRYSAAFKALGSTATVDAREHLGMWDAGASAWTDASDNVPTYWVNGDKVGDSYSDLFDGSPTLASRSTRRTRTRSSCSTWTTSTTCHSAPGAHVARWTTGGYTNAWLLDAMHHNKRRHHD